MYIFCGVIIAISLLCVVFGIACGKGRLRKMLILFTSLLGIVAIICFGGEAVLNHFGMGWRCTPFNTMLNLCFALSIPVLVCSILQLICFIDIADTTNTNALIFCGVCATVLAIVIIPISAFFYFHLSSWQDGLTEYDGQTIVYSNDQHGGSCAWRYYLPINDLVHGVEITQDGWHGKPPYSIYEIQKIS